MKEEITYNQNLFEALDRVCGFTALQEEMNEIKEAIKKDESLQPQTVEREDWEHVFPVDKESKALDVYTFLTNKKIPVGWSFKNRDGEILEIDTLLQEFTQQFKPTIVSEGRNVTTSSETD